MPKSWHIVMFVCQHCHIIHVNQHRSKPYMYLDNEITSLQYNHNVTNQISKLAESFMQKHGRAAF